MITGLQPNTTYSLDVVASNSTGSAWGTVAAVTTSTSNPQIDNPISLTGYIAAPNPTLLWGTNGPQYTDVQQGAAGDCWLLSAYASIAAFRSTYIENMFHYVGTWTLSDGQVAFYNVTFYNDSGIAHTVMVDTELPAGPCPGGYEYDQPVNGVLWAALLEKAYAEANGQEYVDTQNPGQDSYAALWGGYPAWVMTAVTDCAASSGPINSSQITTDLNSGNTDLNSGNAIVCIWTTTPSSPEIVGDHSYGIVGYNPNCQSPFTVYNPWGGNALYNNVWETFYADGSFIDQQFAYMSICIV